MFNGQLGCLAKEHLISLCRSTPMKDIGDTMIAVASVMTVMSEQSGGFSSGNLLAAEQRLGEISWIGSSGNENRAKAVGSRRVIFNNLIPIPRAVPDPRGVDNKIVGTVYHPPSADNLEMQTT